MLTEQNNSAINASRLPARSSLPKGAGKCPIVYVKLSPVCTVKTSVIADSVMSTVLQIKVIHFARRSSSVRQKIAQIIGRKMLKNGKFCGAGIMDLFRLL